MYKPRFLDKVRVSQFAKSFKGYEKGYSEQKRSVIQVENQSPNDIFTVIGKTNWKEGWSEYIGSEEGYGFRETATKQVYILAKSIGRRYYALAEDLIPVEGEANE